MKVILYTTHCPKCRVLEKKMKEKNIEYKEVTDVDKMIDLGFDAVPILDVDGQIMEYKEAVKYLMEEM